ncbi:probable methyltransferase At1g29790 [Mangifera indica]|uniref:probable methyltransferase At1g29790 n=1 Tax=Mangifera indica TaxID=29780 RepID=UPI001CFB63EA|nr:probable methyltransferase At1g29790 [Mangifera indica]XP_044496797.1 probable methyltransferase At1g29790 [Mangifera indica]XP_044496798.1 probable methyltransferase At1g29790 [Mangifera indica]XP_044496799.1 probable methyltransferase At1g29790 [Mangifera indica]XP_044496801.1 probable methyltransferase At1g29790 [Mangifera indica]
MGFTMGLNLVLLLAMVATNILSLYHLSSTSLLSSPKPPTPQQVPDQLLHQLQTIRATINHLTRHQPPPTTTTSTSASTIPQDLLLYSRLSPIASSCHNHPDLIHQYMSYTPFTLCPLDTQLQETLILRGCHPLPRRRCFSRTPPKPSSSLALNPFGPLLDSNVIWTNYNCKSFSCLVKQNPNLGFDPASEKSSSFLNFKTELDLPVPQLFQIAKAANFVIRLGVDVGGATGSFAARMKLYNVTVLTTTMNLGAPYSEAVALRGLVPLHVPLQQRLPIFDGVVDLVRCGHAVNRWIPLTMMDFLFYDVDRVLRAGGYLWLDRFFSKEVDLEKVYGPLIGKLGYKKVKWATATKNAKTGDVYLTALLQKPVSK